MALPVAPTPTLKGDEAEALLSKVYSEDTKVVYLVPTPDIEKVRKQILADAAAKE